ncbi:hypothetical protein BU23DRAFT_460421 [Bimuria novae-zelandiae CBS 107.79]|uniref:Uncharacterized protein n=1 Tax=Bimuria novae-zelandiae CBS 107.79 TaxID=1447943 RepID=A0A6A5VDX6_9PLEO|nr:hypothetical protein BU23DRAFT_460421 [Bimuria novae-zelandiae CBS 107.79]
MQLHTLFTIFLAAVTATAAATPSGDIIARFPSPSTILSSSEHAELQKRKCDCGKEFSCKKSVAECCKGTDGYGMCKTDVHRCKCGHHCNPFECVW